MVANKQVVIKPLNKQKWSGLIRYPKCYQDLVPQLVGPGVYNTGLTEEEATELEKKLRLKEGELAPTSDYWTTLTIRIAEKPVRLNLNSPMDYLRYKVALAHQRIANSVTEVYEWPYAEYVIYDEEEDAKLQNVKINYKRKAYSKFDSMSLDEMRGILKMYGKRRPESTSNEVIENTLANLVEEDPQKFLSIVEDKKLKTKILIEDLLSAGIIKKNGTHFVYGQDSVAHDLEAMVIFLEDAKNQSVLLTMKKDLESKRK